MYMPRKKGYRTPDEIREKIKGSHIIKRLQDHIDVESMSPSQVNAAKVLLAKIIPDLKATDITSGGDKIKLPSEIVLKAASDNGND